MIWIFFILGFLFGFSSGVAVVLLIDQWHILKDMEKFLNNEK